jgi:2-keto-4-pentenoate hydratase/2-oxohepta-3-ene-1,7-dioic acid hydratase in catechol pathway
METSHGVHVRGRPEPLNVGKIIALGGNYRAHVREMGGAPDQSPVVFLKPPSALIADGDTVLRPAFSLQLHHEVELVVAIGKRGKHLEPRQSRAHVLGYAVGLDMTLRDVQTEAKRRGHPWAVAKGFDTSAPVSEIIPAADIPDPEELAIELRVNGSLRQQARAGDLSLPLDDTVAYVSSIFTLEPGDLIFTGTPAGVDEVHPGDVLEASLVDWTSLAVTVADDGADRASPDA